MREVKCPHCGEWNPSEAAVCKHCGKVVTDARKQEHEDRERQERNSVPIMKINPEDSFWQKMWKRPFQIAQLIFLTVLSTIAAIASSTVH